MRKKRNKKAQVTIFIIIALIIVVSIALIYVIWRKPSISLQPETNPNSYIEKCVKDSVEETFDIIMKQGGYVSPGNYKLYDNEKISYLCYSENHLPCANQVMLISHLEQEITKDIEGKVQGCFNLLKSELENKNYEVELADEMQVTTELESGKVVVTIDKELAITKNEETRSFKKFKTEILSPIYDLAKTSIEILNGEAASCDFDYVSYMMLYHDYKISRDKLGDSTEIYTIGDKETGKEFKFATKGCIIPAPGVKIV